MFAIDPIRFTPSVAQALAPWMAVEGVASAQGARGSVAGADLPGPRPRLGLPTRVAPHGALRRRPVRPWLPRPAGLRPVVNGRRGSLDAPGRRDVPCPAGGRAPRATA